MIGEESELLSSKPLAGKMKMKIISDLFIITILVLMMCGCSDVDTEIIQASIGTSTPSPNAQISTKSPSQTSVPELIEINATHTPSKTKAPSATLPPEEATKLAVFRATDQVRINYLETGVPATIEARHANCDSQMHFEMGRLFVVDSSTEDWTVYTCSPDEGFEGRYTQVTSIDLSRSWRIYHQDFDWSQREQALLAPHRWSYDGEYLFLVPFTYFGPCGGDFNPIPRFLNGRVALYRLDLQTGEFEIILDQIGEENLWTVDYAFSLAPNNRYLAWAMYDEHKLFHIVDLEDGSERIIELDDIYEVVGAFVWSPDSRLLLYSAGIEGFTDNTAGVSLFRYDVESGHNQIILFGNMKHFVPAYNSDYGGYWVDDNHLNVQSLRDDMDYGFTDWSLDITYGHLTLLPAPAP